MPPSPLGQNTYDPIPTADGNCLYSSISKLLVNSEKLCHILRCLSVIEIVLNLSYYAHHPFFKNSKILNENNLFVKTLSNKCVSEFNRENREYCLLQQAKLSSINYTFLYFMLDGIYVDIIIVFFKCFFMFYVFYDSFNVV